MERQRKRTEEDEDRKKQRKKILQKSKFENDICTVLPCIILSAIKEKKKKSLSFNVIFHLLFFKVKQTMTRPYVETSYFNTEKMVHKINK